MSEHEEATETGGLDAAREAILDQALDLADFEGWSVPVLRRAALEAGYDRATQLIAFPKGVPDLLARWSQRCDAAAVDALHAQDLGEMRIRDKIRLGVRLRIEAMAPHKAAARHASHLLASPLHAGLGARLGYATADKIWQAIGDTSTDFNHYSKRGILTGVLSATILYWVQDQSAGDGDTWAFLDRRIDNVMQFEKVKARVQKAARGWPSPSGLFRREGNGPRR